VNGTDTDAFSPDEPRPLRWVNPRPLPMAGPLAGREVVAPPSWTYREVLPCYVKGSFAVYEIDPGRFLVTRNGEASGRPFETQDLDLARVVCDWWAVEFAEAVGEST
jgi:hypothetical protein